MREKGWGWLNLPPWPAHKPPVVVPAVYGSTVLILPRGCSYWINKSPSLAALTPAQLWGIVLIITAPRWNWWIDTGFTVAARLRLILTTTALLQGRLGLQTDISFPVLIRPRVFICKSHFQGDFKGRENVLYWYVNTWMVMDCLQIVLNSHICHF